jgi:hypothetical protein
MTTYLEQQAHYAKLLAELMNRKPPHQKESFPVLPLTSKTFGTHNKAFNDLVEELLPKVTQSNRHDVKVEHRKCLKHVIFSLVHAMFNWECLSLPVSEDSYKNVLNDDGLLVPSHMSRLGFTRRITERIINTLSEGTSDKERSDKSSGWMFQVCRGYMAADGTRRTAAVYFPTKKFIEMFCHALYTDFGGWDDLTDDFLYRFNNFLLPDLPSISTYGNKIKILREYNNFMRDQSWAMKNPSTRAMNMYSPRGGRINNYYQNIANRRYKVRTNTLLNGDIIEECDFSANHLWMFSYLVGEELPQDAYEAIVKQSGCKRDVVKSVTTRLLGSTSLTQKGMLTKEAHKAKVPCSADSFRAIESALYSEYPWLEKHNAFYHDRGAWLQGLEGDISIQMMQWCTQNQIPLLAVHDAYAVNINNAKATEEMMHHMREGVLNYAKHTKYLDLASSKQPLVVARIKSEKERKKIRIKGKR